MASDRLLRVSGPPQSATAPSLNVNHVEAAPVAATGDAGLVAADGYKHVGKYQACEAHCRIGGAFTATGTIQFAIYEANDAAGNGVGATPIASSPVLSRAHAGNPASGTAALRDNVPPTVFGFTTGSGGFVKARYVAGGTSPSAAGVSCVIVPVGTSTRRSGV